VKDKRRLGRQHRRFAFRRAFDPWREVVIVPHGHGSRTGVVRVDAVKTVLHSERRVAVGGDNAAQYAGLDVARGCDRREVPAFHGNSA
jgi:hypothetical protein